MWPMAAVMDRTDMCPPSQKVLDGSTLKFVVKFELTGQSGQERKASGRRHR